MVHGPGSWTWFRWWSMDWGQCYVYTLSYMHWPVGTDDHRVKTFLMQHTGSRNCYSSLRKWCFGHFRPDCCLIFQPVCNFPYITLHISMRAMMRCHSNHWQECLLTPPPPQPPKLLVFYPRSILKILYVDSDWCYLLT